MMTQLMLLAVRVISALTVFFLNFFEPMVTQLIQLVTRSCRCTYCASSYFNFCSCDDDITNVGAVITPGYGNIRS